MVEPSASGALASDDPCAGLRAELAARPGDPTLREALGRCLVESDRIQSGERVLRDLLRDQPGCAAGRALLAAALVRMGRTDEALREARAAVDTDPGLAEAHLQRCWVERRAGNVEAAVDAGRRAVELAPTPTALNYLCVACLSTDRADEALSLTERCLDADPRNIAALNYRTSALAMAGRVDEGRALCDFERFMWMDRLTSVEGYADLTTFNRALIQQVLDAPSREMDWQQTVDLANAPDGPAAAFRRIVDAATGMYLRRLPPPEPGHPFLRYRPRAWDVHTWGTRTRELAPQEHHIHQQAWLGGVYYASVPDGVGEDLADIGGCIEFARFLRYSDQALQTEAMVLPPREGVIVMFPAYFPHRVLPFRSDTVRVSLAFNIIARD